MNYGLPYKGSKNRIAKKILDILPAAPVLYDVFCGGCAIPTRRYYQANIAEWLQMISMA